MSVRKEFTTKSGLTLPLINLKGKEYLLAAHRIQWFVQENESFSIQTSKIEGKEGEWAAIKAIITVYDENGKAKRTVEGTKTEERKHFEDFIEKATTGAISRALSYLGYGTQFSGDELNELVNEKGVEVNRLADAPLATSKPAEKTETVKTNTSRGFGVKGAAAAVLAQSEPDTGGWE